MREANLKASLGEEAAPKPGRGRTGAQKAPPGGAGEKRIRIPPAAIVSGLAGVVGIALLAAPFLTGTYSDGEGTFSVSGLDLVSGAVLLSEMFTIPLTSLHLSLGTWLILAGAVIAVAAMLFVVKAADVAGKAGGGAPGPSMRRRFGVFVRGWSGVFKLAAAMLLSGVGITLLEVIMLWPSYYNSILDLGVVLPGIGLLGEFCVFVVILEQSSEMSDYAKRWL